MVKSRTLYFVNTRRRTISQHWKKKRAREVLMRLKRRGIKAKIVSRKAKWVY